MTPYPTFPAASNRRSKRRPATSRPPDVSRPRIHRLDSITSSRSRRHRHISSDDLEKMVVPIVHGKTPLAAHLSAKMAKPEALATISVASVTTATPIRDGAKDNHPPPPPAPTFATVRKTGTSRVPVPVPLPQAADAATDAIFVLSGSPASKSLHVKKTPTKLDLDGSCSSRENKQTVNGLRYHPPNDDTSRRMMPKERKVAPSVPLPRVDGTEGGDIDECAIDDEEDWEDSYEESGKSSVDDKFFQRVESKANLVSRPSLITLMLAQDQRTRSLSNNASQSTSAIPRSRTAPQGMALGASPSDSDEGPLMMKGSRQPSLLKPISEIPRSAAQPINAPANHVHAQAAYSPRTTRRNMLATELTESLRRHLLWERQQKTSTANAVLKRRHTSHDVANLKQFPDKPCLKESENANAGSWNQYLNRDALNGYHSKGW